MPDLLVMHYTAGTGDAEKVGNLFALPSRQASAHFAIGRDGGVVQCVPLDDAAWHAGDHGNSRFPLESELVDGVAPLATVERRPKLVNRRSVGIELCNLGYGVGIGAKRVPDDRIVEGVRHRNPRSHSTTWERFPTAQTESLTKLVAEIVAEVPTLKFVCGHEDVTHYDVANGSKLDPGPAFPWECLTSSRLARVLYDFEARAWRTA